jgi:hypothetical protein
MPEMQRVFAKGRMNKDLDERMVPNGEYRDALNLDLSVSEGSDVGAFENIKGNKEIIHKAYNSSTLLFTNWDSDYISNLADASCAGVIKDEETEKIYWFIASNEVNAIAQYDQSLDVVTPLLVEKKTVSNFLNFTADNIITGINILKGILFWTDNKTEPKKIVIADWQNSTSTFLNHSQIYGRNFIEQDITVIKKYPLVAPVLELKRTKREGNIEANISYEFVKLDDDGEPIELGFDTPEQILNFTTAVNFQVGDELKIELIDDAVEFNENYEIRAVVTERINKYKIKIQIQTASDGLPTGVFPYKVILNEAEGLFKFKYPRFATRYKYKDNQYSVFSPFSKVAFLPNTDFKYDSERAYNLSMVNQARVIKISNIVPDFSTIPADVVSIDILYKETGNNAVYKVDTINRDSKEWIANEYNIENELISSVVEANQILRPFDNVPKTALTQEIVANRLIYGNYKQNYNMLSSQNEKIEPKFSFSITQRTENEYETMPSIKSQRTYQLGIVYIDKYGRQSPVFSSNSATKFIDKSNVITDLSIKNKMLSDSPAWATHFKYFIKENSSEYYNLAMDRWYDAEDGNIWISFPSSDRDKITQESFIELKKEHDNNTPVLLDAKYKVISISNNAPDFLKLTKKSQGVLEYNFASLGNDIVANGFPLENRLSFKIDRDTFDNAAFAKLKLQDTNIFVKISSNTDISDFFEIANIKNPIGDSGGQYQINLVKKFDSTIAFTSTDGTYENNTGTTLTIEFFKQSSETKPEFEGRFFVKLYKDSLLESGILGDLTDNYATITRQSLAYRTSRGDDGRWDWHISTWGDQCSANEWLDRGGRAGKGERYNRDTGQTFALEDKDLKTYGAKANSKQLSISITGNDGKGDMTGGSKWGSNMTRWRDLGYIHSKQYIDFVKALDTKGTYFRFVDDPTEPKPVYKIVESRRIHRAKVNRNARREGKFASERVKYWNLKLDKEIIWSPESVLQANNMDITTEIEILRPYYEDNNTFSSSNPAIWETEPKESVDLDLYYAASDIYPISEHKNIIELPWYNCWTFRNGLESNRIRDDFAATYLDNNPIASTVLEEPYQEEHRSTGLIFSQIFNSQSGVNNLNQFILAEAITKDLNPRHGSIQKLHARDTDMVALCEDKCFSIPAQKDLLFNADGSANVTSNTNVLGTARPYAGNFGISRNPESFADYGNKMYFTDKNRGVVIRLSGGLGGGDGITLISAKGMADYFEDNLQLNTNLIGSYDTTSGSYNLLLNNTNSTLSYQEAVDGWVGRFSFLKEQGVSINNKYYTFKEGRIWEHKANTLFNNFYGIQYDSQFTVLLNDAPYSVKNFKTLNYTGSEARNYKYETGNGIKYSLAEIQAKNLTPISEAVSPGWWVESINTDLQQGQLKTFLDKEGKYFNYIKGTTTTLSNVDSKEFSVQGIGTATVTGADQSEYNVHVYVNDACFAGNYTVHVYVNDTCFTNN